MSGLSQPSPSNTSRLLRRALRAHGEGDVVKAQRLYDAVLQHDAANFDALHGLGQLHCQHGRLDTALVLIQAALRHDGSRAEGFATLGLVFHLLRRFAEALASYDAGLALAPGDAELLSRRGVALLELSRREEALGAFESALAADPCHLDALGNYGNALLKLNRPAEAVAAYDRALALVPDNPQLLTNRAVALRRLDRPQQALICVRRALAAQPDFAQARFVESLTRLTLGDFAAGWRGYEARWSVGLLAGQRRNFAAPAWLGDAAPGQSLAGKTILLHAEQGFGDTLQFVRYARLVAARGADKIILEVQRELAGLLAGVAGIDQVIARGDALPAFDCHCPLLSLPLAFGTTLATIPAAHSYVTARTADVERWRARLPRPNPARRLIGLVWAGDPVHDNDLNRSLPLAALTPLLASPDIDFVSLQYKIRDTDRVALRDHPSLLRLGEEFSDFADTAAVVAGLDAVIAVDTAVAHLAGAMGRPLFLMLPYAADFRWLRERSDSPWYPTARLYRQPRFGDWNAVVAAVARDLPLSRSHPEAVA